MPRTIEDRILTAIRHLNLVRAALHAQAHGFIEEGEVSHEELTQAMQDACDEACEELYWLSTLPKRALAIEALTDDERASIERERKEQRLREAKPEAAH
jgi:hypothetical protein